ncbi:unnamed protein product [Prunus armeniaca]
MSGGFLSSINEMASSVCATVRSHKSKHGNETSVDTGNNGSTGGTSTESTADTHQAVNLSSVDFNGVFELTSTQGPEVSLYLFRKVPHHRKAKLCVSSSSCYSTCRNRE